MNIYHGDFKCRESIEEQFRVTLPADVEILFALYSQMCYSGEALVLFRQNGCLYEVHGSHCSCYGLEDQWQPEETSVAALLNWYKNASCWQDDAGYHEDYKHAANDFLLALLQFTFS